MNKILDIFWRRWPYLVTGLLCIIAAFSLYKGLGQYILFALIGIPALIFLMKRPVAVIVTQIAYCSIIQFFTDNLGLDGAAIYFSDVLTLLVLVHIIMNFPTMGYKLKALAIPGIFLLLIFVVHIIGSIYIKIDLINFIWGMRIYYRFPIFLVGCVMFINRKAFDTIWKLIAALVVIQVIVASYQFFILGYDQDSIGGTFGLRGSGLLVQFFALALLLAYLRYTEKQCSVLTVWLVMIAGLYVGVINEGKAIFVFDIIIFVIIFFQNGISMKKIFWLVLVAGLFVASNYFLGLIYPQFANFLSFDAMNEYVTSESYGGIAINRLNGPEYFSRYFDTIQDWFGVGLGNAAMSKYAVLQGDFYQRFYLTYYNWFYIAYVYAESGYLGLYLNIGFFVSFLLTAYKMRNKMSSNYTAFLIGMVFSCLLTICYNNSLLTEESVAFTYYILLGLPLAMAVNESHDYNYYPSRRNDCSPLAAG